MKNSFEQAPESAMEAKKEEIIYNVLTKVLHGQGKGMSARENIRVESEAGEASREAVNRKKLEPVIRGLYDQYMVDSQGIPPTEEEFANYVESKSNPGK